MVAGESSDDTACSSSASDIRVGDHAGASPRAVLVCAFVALVGLFHGYDNGVVSLVFEMHSFRGMMGWPHKDDSMVAFMKGLTVNGFNIGAAIAAVLSGHFLVDRCGRKPALIVGSVLFALGGAMQAFANGAHVLISGRVVSGVGVGITSGAGPAYISEVSPSSIRGAMVGLYQNNICLAIVGASLLNYLDQYSVNGWRWSLGVQFFIGALVSVGLAFVDETPRFLESVGRSSDALRVLTALRGGDARGAEKELSVVRAEITAEKEAGDASWVEVFTNPFFRNVVIIGCLLQFFQIMTGINAMVSYGGTLFESLGVRGMAAALTPSIAFTVGNAIGSFVLVDRAGRRPLLILGMVAMGITLLVGGITNLTAARELGPDGEARIAQSTGYVIIAMVVGFEFSFGISWGFGAWLYVSEIMPLRVRGKAVGLCTGVNWGPANVISAFITPVMIAGQMGPGGTLLFFGCVSVVVVPFVLLFIPETKGRTLEQVTPLFHFTDCRGFKSFARGNLQAGSGCEVPQATKSQEEDSDAQEDSEANASEIT